MVYRFAKVMKQAVLCMRLSGISGMEQWNGILEIALTVVLGIFLHALQILLDVV